MKATKIVWLLAGTLLAAPVTADDYTESIDGDLSDDPAAPTVLALSIGSNTVTGTVQESDNIAGGDRDFITFTVPHGQTLTAINLAIWDTNDNGFIAINDGATGFIPGAGTIGDFLAGTHVGTGDLGDDLLEALQTRSLTTNALSVPSLGPGTYTFVIQQVSAVLQGYSMDLVLTESNRQVQVLSVDFDTSVIELFNFAEVDVDLTGWRFCTHDFNEVRRYTSAAGLTGVTIEAGTSIFIHHANDAPADPDRINRSTLAGNFATPLDQDAFGMQFFFPSMKGGVSFGNSALIADHIQWNINGASVGSAQFRTKQAVGQGLWSATGDFIVTAAETLRIDLTDLSGDIAGSPAEYDVTNPCPGDIADDFGTLGGDGMVSFGDFLALLGLVGPCPGGTPGCTGDIADDFGTLGPDGVVSFGDFLALLGLVGPCP